MNVIVRHADRVYEVSVDVDGPATVADLVTALGHDPAHAMTVDGRGVPAQAPLTELGLRDGSMIEIGTVGRTAMPMVGSGVFNRPPRMIDPVSSVEMAPPSRPDDAGGHLRFGWAALVVPIVLGVTMAALVHPRMAAFALFSPVMLLANWFEERRRIRSTRRRSASEYAQRLQEFEAQLARAQRLEIERRSRADCGPDQLLHRCLTMDTRLWERRSSHADFMQIPIGTGCVGWDVPVGDSESGAATLINRYGTLHDAPICIGLRSGAVVGIAGDRSATLAVARQLVLQAVVNQGPADLAVSVLTERAEDWDWAKWLPHVLTGAATRRRIATTPGEIESVVKLLPRDPESSPQQLLVVDLSDLATGNHTQIRSAMRSGEVAAIVLAGRVADLPSAATTVVATGEDRCQVRVLNRSDFRVIPWTIGRRQMRQAAWMLARIDDPEAAVVGIELPPRVALVDLLGLSGDLDGAIRARWQSPGPPATVVGVAEDGPVELDIAVDGPHALVGGTTGAGKSELLRSLVVGLAIAVGPDALNLVLVDYKGGSAFDACADLPHTVGVVTDLDERLAARALACLDAELRYREQRLRDGGVPDIEGLTSGNPLPRLLVVVDEFAALAAELPEFISALVGIAQRGRSLGVHLLLATQRPNGVIDDNIKANTNLRIALRMQDAADSVDVIGRPDAISVPRSLPGRALARRGPADVVAFQAALVSGHRLVHQAAAVTVRPFLFAHEQPGTTDAAAPSASGPSDLEQIVAASQRVAVEMALPRPRSPWPDPLPERVARCEIGEVLEEAWKEVREKAAYGLADEPHLQRIIPVTYDPGAGNLLLYGLPGSGTTTTLGTLAIALAASHDPGRLHIHVLDFDDQQLTPLRGLSHVGSVVAGGERDRQLRLLRKLATELDRRREGRSEYMVGDAQPPTVVTMIDNYGGLSGAFGEPGELNTHDLIARLVADGPGLGMVTLIAAKQPADIPARIAATVAGRLVFRLADRYDYAGLGLPAVSPPAQPGRAIEAGTGREIQVALPHRNGLKAAVAEIPGQRADPRPWSISALPREVALADFAAAGTITDDEWFLPLGIGDSTLRPAGLLLRDGEHALIIGPPRSGKTTALLTAARVARQALPSLRIAAIAPRSSAVCSTPEVTDVVTCDQIDEITETGSRLLLLIDDAELLAGGEALSRLLARRPSGLRIIASGSGDVIRGLYGHWTQDLRRSRVGCALRPGGPSDGDFWQTPLPRHRHQSFPPGRGYLLAAGRTELIQLGRP